MGARLNLFEIGGTVLICLYEVLNGAFLVSTRVIMDPANAQG